MTNKQDDSNPILAGLNDIGKILARALQKYLAAYVLIILIAGLVAIYFGTTEAIIAFFCLAAFGLVFLFILEVSSQRKQIRTPVPASFDTTRDTLSIVDRLSENQKRDILGALRGAVEDVADALRIRLEFVRANLFGEDNHDRMKMFREFTFNMNREEELAISMPVGYGSTGRCFQSGKPNIAVFREDWGKDVIEDEELLKVHPDLRWIISVPILARGDGVQPFWVLNVDGLNERRREDELRGALSRLFSWSQYISLVITGA